MYRPLEVALVVISSAAPREWAQEPAPLHDTTAYVVSAIPLRLQPAMSAAVVDSLRVGTRVRVHVCAHAWCTITVGDHSGYVRVESLTLQPPKPAAASQGRGYVNSRGQWVPSPARTPNNQPPAGATAKCRDGTFSFSQSRRGTCSHHGGVAQWL